MKLRCFFLNNSGFNLLETSIAIGLMGLAGMAVVTLTDISNKDTRSAEMAFQKIDFFSSADKFLRSKKACDELKLKGPFSTTKPLELTKWKVAGIEGNPDLPMSAGRKFKNFSIKVFETSPVLPSGTNVSINGVEGQKANLKITLSLEYKVNQKKKSTSPSQIFKKEFILPVVVDSTKKIIGCESNPIQSACSSADLFYDPDSKTCKPLNADKHCFISGTFSMLTHGTSSDPYFDPNLINRNDVTNTYGCTPDEVKVATGAFGRAFDSCPGSKNAPCPSYWNVTYYSCLKCLETTSGGTSGGGTSGGGTSGGGTFGGAAGGVAGCFVAGTEINMFDGTKKLIEDVNLGDELIDVYGNKLKTLKLLSYDYDGPIYSINGGPYFFTPNHPFLTISGWKSLNPELSMLEAPDIKVSSLGIGDILVKSSGVEVILSLDSIQVKEKVYNFTLDGNHQYIANEFAVHNKAAIQQAL